MINSILTLKQTIFIQNFVLSLFLALFLDILVIGIILALSALVVVREVAPYENPSTNILANIAQLQLLATCERATGTSRRYL